MIRLATIEDLRTHHHALGLYCAACDRWAEADLAKLSTSGLGKQRIDCARFRCRNCGTLADKQVRPPVPTGGPAVPYI